MVLQRHKPIPVWGWATPGAVVEVTFADRVASVVADAENGQWVVELPAMPASSEGRALTVTQRSAVPEQTQGGEIGAGAAPGGAGDARGLGDPEARVVFADVLVGEVWLCGGQSNMEWPLRKDRDADAAVAAADVPTIRVFRVTPYVTNLEPQDDLPDGSDAAWIVSTPETAPKFTAVGYYFARRLHDELGVPVGIIASYWGGTRIESWTSRPTLDATPAAVPLVQHFDDIVAHWDDVNADWKKQLERPQFHDDPGDILDTAVLAQGPPQDPAVDLKTTERPPRMAGDVDGVAWFATTFELPDGWAGQDLTLKLGVIDDIDVTYINGTEVGRTGMDTPKWWTVARNYAVPDDVLKPGVNTLAVRVFDRYGTGGLMDGVVTLAPATDDEGNGNDQADNTDGNADNADANTDANTDANVNANGDAGADHALLLTGWTTYGQNPQNPADIRGPGSGGKPYGPGSHHQPAGLYNAMIHPVAPYAMRGALWYQGESNAGRGAQYRDLQPALIHDWRRAWAASPWDAPSADTSVDAEEPLWFFIAQLPDFKAFEPEPTDPPWNWAELRDAQLNTTRHVARTGVGINIHLGSPKTIHPTSKVDVAGRLARWALVDTYGVGGIVKSGPMFRDAFFENGQAVVSFDRFGSALALQKTAESDAHTLGGFLLAGEDRVFHNAQAEIDGDTVRVWCDAVPEPVAVRYGWQNNPADANLFNAAGLPASPFRSDDWPGVTAGKWIK